MARRIHERKHDQSGAAAVEFALVMPVLMVLVFGVISFGVIFAQKLALGNGAREAARYAVVEGRTCDQVEAAARDAANTIAMSGEQVGVQVRRGVSEAMATDACSNGSASPCAVSGVGDSIFVELTFGSELIIPLVVADSDFELSGTGVFRCEFS